MAAEKVTVNAKIAEGVTAQFESADDFCIFFCSSFPYGMVATLCQEVTGKPLTTKQYNHYRAQVRCAAHILTTAKCSDGHSLLDHVKRKVNL